MRLGVISDVHADASALARALSVLERRGAVRVVCLGDVVEKGDEGDRVVDMLRANAVITVRGNHDEGAARAHREEGDPSLRRGTVAWLEALPATREYRWETERVMLAHGAPHKVDEYVFAEKVPKRFKKALRGLEQDLLLLGHTHAPMALRLGALWVVNPGSVAGTRARDSHTCATVELPGCAPRFYDLADGAEREVRPVGGDAAEAEPE
ncbi:MAG: metallophosphoesterase family protein [Polyangiales bacterium]